MSEESTIVIKATDRYSETVKRKGETTKSFGKNLGKTEDVLTLLSKNKATIRVDVKQAKSALQDAEKQFAKTRSEADKLKLETAQADYDNMVRNLKSVTKAAGDTEKAISKIENTATSFQVLSVLSHKRELLNWWAMPLWTHDKIPKAIGAEHIQFHDLRYAFVALSLKNRGGRKTVIWGCRATIRMDPPFAPTPIPHPKRSRALGAPSASRYGKNRRPSICRSCGLSVFRFAGLTFFKTVFSARLPPAPRRTAGTAPALPDQFAHRTPQWGSQADTPR